MIVLKDEKRAIFTAASHAQKAADRQGLPLEGHSRPAPQLAAAEAAQASQLTLFATLYDDRRPPSERAAAGRYLQPSPFEIQAAQTTESRP
jgi:hypothetical protein